MKRHRSIAKQNRPKFNINIEAAPHTVKGVSATTSKKHSVFVLKRQHDLKELLKITSPPDN